MNDAPDRKLWGAAEAYESYMGRWSRLIASHFLLWLDAEAHGRWVDLGCGTGALSRQVMQTCRPSSLLGLDLSEAFLQAAKHSVPEAEFMLADATDTGLPNAEFDYAVSGLVLNFTRDPRATLREMVRLVRPGGRVALYVWDYAGHMQIMRSFFDVARAIDSGAAAFDDGINAPICRPGPLRRALEEAGAVDVEVTAVDIPAAFPDFDAYWSPFLGGTGSAPKYVAGLSDDVRNRIRDAVQAALPTGPDGEILLAVRAWAVKGTVAE
ncbi:class I SAM-dependent methyltransferase [Deinococcus yavapaiensis]|uniref:Methyltransferase family protein n=1 Tax=Deinococcus yavapaiensis KR-236 TaxID=694435 RepID=A0A318S5V0_9DEIO|nr:class I SAM-dependent methyltransferase [Deinococcus yavapaiensis]PYE54162.1 methyltransferase family protein [Deinococcus yavapaiensis KR-236]